MTTHPRSRHLCFILPGYPPESHASGIGTYGKLAVDALSAQGFRITVLSRSLEKERSVENNGNVTIVRIPSPDMAPNGLNLTGFSKTVFAEWAAINEGDPFDYTECADWGGEGREFVRRNTPANFTIRIHSPGFLVERMNPGNPSYLSGETKIMEQEALAGAPFIIANSSAALDAIRERVRLKARTFIAPYVCPPRTFAGMPVRDDDGFLQIACVGRLEERKGSDLLIKALGELGPGVRVRAVFIGHDTPLKDGGTFKDVMLKGAPGWLTERLSFTGAIPHEDVFRILRESHGAVQPARFENFAFAMLEPMSIGRPVIIPDLAALNDMRGPCEAFTFKAGSASSLAASLKHLTGVEQTGLNRLAREYHAFYKARFSDRSTVDKTVAIINSIINGSSAAPEATNFRIVAIGGGEIGRPGFPVETTAIDREIVALSGRQKPNLLFVGTAMNDDALYFETVRKHFGGTLGCQVRNLKLSGPGDPGREMDAALKWADIVYVGAGNTGAMLARWRELGFDNLLAEAGRRGKVLCGLSAGGVCWFANCLSMPSPDRIECIAGLGFVPGTASPHFDTQPKRRDFARGIVERNGGAVIGIDERSALIFSGGRYKVVSARQGAGCTLIQPENGGARSLALRQNVYADSLEELASQINMPMIMNGAFAHMIANRNIVHTPLHAARVYENAMLICAKEGLALSAQQQDALAIACFWHDAGRVDASQATDNHHERSAELLWKFNEIHATIPAKTLKMASDMILSHRNRGGTADGSQRTVLQNVLWDADKLDVLNPLRMREIMHLYSQGITAGEFTPEETLKFWNSIDKRFIGRFTFPSARARASARWKEFKSTRGCFIHEFGLK
jgi:peptidase E/glycosyltransferase involved in cell wall biosynthesis